MRYYNYCNSDEDSINIRDSVKATVLDSDRRGVYLRLDTGERAYSYHSKLFQGTRVTCCIEHLATETHSILVSIDSVDDDLMCA